MLCLCCLRSRFVKRGNWVHVGRVLGVKRGPLCQRVTSHVHRRVTHNRLGPNSTLPARSTLRARFNIDQIAIHRTLHRLIRRRVLRDVRNDKACIGRRQIGCSVFRLADFSRGLSSHRISARDRILVFRIVPTSSFLRRRLRVATRSHI